MLLRQSPAEEDIRPMTATWYVLQSKPNKEVFLYNQLRSNDLEAFCPCIRVQPVNPRAHKNKPYFPGYVFIQLDLEKIKRSNLTWMSGATGFVSFDGRPADVPESFVQSIRKRVDKINEAGGELLASLRPGEKVQIQDGPFAGYEAIFDTRISGNERVRVFLKILAVQYGRQMQLELPAGQIQKIKQR